MEAQEWQGFPNNDNGWGNLAPSMGGNENLLGGAGEGVIVWWESEEKWIWPFEHLSELKQYSGNIEFFRWGEMSKFFASGKDSPIHQ